MYGRTAITGPWGWKSSRLISGAGAVATFGMAATAARSSAIAYGVEIPAPQVEGVHPLKESDLFAVEMGDPEKLGLLASDATGAFHHVVCKDALCTVDEASALLAMCRNERQCKIVRAVREKTFFPLYLSDADGGHVCSPGWG